VWPCVRLRPRPSAANSRRHRRCFSGGFRPSRETVRAGGHRPLQHPPLRTGRGDIRPWPAPARPSAQTQRLSVGSALGRSSECRRIALRDRSVFRLHSSAGLARRRIFIGCRGDGRTEVLARPAAAAPSTTRPGRTGISRRRRRDLARVSFRRRGRALARRRGGMRRLGGRRRLARNALVAWILRRGFSRVHDRLLELNAHRMRLCGSL